MLKIRIVILLLLVTLQVPALIQAEWSTVPTENNTVYVGPEDQDEAKTISDGAGGVIVVWTISYNSTPKLYAQRIDANGNLL